MFHLLRQQQMNTSSADNDQPPNKPHFRYFKELVGNNLMSDVTFVFRPDNESVEIIKVEIRIPAHKVILGAISSVFRQMFFGLLAEKHEIAIDDILPNTFLEMLTYIYSGDVEYPNQDINVLCQLYYCSEKYDLQDMQTAVSNQIVAKLDETNALRTLETIRQFENENLNKRISEFIRKHTLPIIRHDSFKFIQRTTLNWLLKEQNNLNAMELHLFSACLYWAKAECARNSIQEPTPQQIRQTLGEELFFIRISQMTQQEFMQEPFMCGIFNHNELVQLVNSMQTGLDRLVVLPEFVAKFCRDPRPLTAMKRIHFKPSVIDPKQDMPNQEFGNSIRFECSSEVYLGGFSFNSSKNFVASDLNVWEEQSVVYHQKNLIFELDEKMDDLHNFLFKRPLLIRSNTIYEIRFQLLIIDYATIFAFHRGESSLKYKRSFQNSTITFTYHHPNPHLFEIKYLEIY